MLLLGLMDVFHAGGNIMLYFTTQHSDLGLLMFVKVCQDEDLSHRCFLGNQSAKWLLSTIY